MASTVASPFNTNPAYSGTFIPALWSTKLNAKFYKSTVFGEIANTDWEGELKNKGDKVTINNIPTLAISDYVVGTALSYQVPTPSTVELVIDKAKYFAFQVSDVLAHQSNIKLMDTFSNDAADQMKIKIDSSVLYNTFKGAATGNFGTAAGVASGAYTLGTDATPVAMSAAEVLNTITSLSGVLDEQNVPETDRWLLLDPATRNWLLQSNLAQAQFMGDDTSIVRNGRVGGIDRFKVYITNQLPKAAAGTATPWNSGDGSETSITSTGTVAKRRVIMAGHKSAITFASQMTKLETVRNTADFGDYVRGLNVYGFKVVKPEALAFAVVN